MALNNQAERRGPPPFNNATASDLIIRSADGFNFYVLKRILEEASPTLGDILSAPHPPVDEADADDYIDGKPVLKLTEGYSAVHWLLRCCYAVDVDQAYRVQDAIDLFHCLDKFQVQTARTEGERAVLSISARNAFVAFAVACKVGLKDLAATIVERAISRFTYDQEMDGLRCLDGGIAMHLLDGPLIVSLWDYHRRYREAATNVVNERFLVDEDLGRDRLPMWSKESTNCCPETLVPVFLSERDEFDNKLNTEPSPYDHPDMYRFKNWFLAYLKEVKVAMTQGPVLEQLTPTQPALRAAAAASNCPKCCASFEPSFALFVELYKQRARSEVARVCTVA